MSISISTVSSPVSTSSSAAPASTSPSFVWQPIAEMFTCGQTNVRWTYTGSASPLTLNITNIMLPAGSFEFHRTEFDRLVCFITRLVSDICNVQNTVQATSSSFFVQNGTNTNCVPQYAVGVPVPSTGASSSSTSHVPVVTSSPSSAQSGHSHAGAIAGGVVGGLALLGVVAAIFLCFLRRRTPRARIRDEDGGRRWSELSFRKRSSNNTRSSMQKTLNPHAEQTIIGSDEEISTVGHEKAIATAQALAHPLPQQPPPQQPVRSQSFRTSTQTSGSYRDGRVTANPERPGSRTSFGAHPEAIPMEPTNLQHSPSLTSPRRKPAPRYDAAMEAGQRDGRSSSQTTLDHIQGNSTNGTPDSFHILQHKSSFGAVRPMHVMTSDPPAAVSP
ncbi:hypothetical protein BGY98DRAFT_1097966 [Russula aff. rugulosa BPL654]|nr:hypothetical protein BGY98DRAFT_1097966 [Russula aff. rugulosa BPL654]